MEQVPPLTGRSNALLGGGLPHPFLPSPPCFFPFSFPFPSSPRSGTTGSGERCKLPQWGLGHSPGSKSNFDSFFESRKCVCMIATILLIFVWSSCPLKCSVLNFCDSLHRRSQDFRCGGTPINSHKCSFIFRYGVQMGYVMGRVKSLRPLPRIFFSFLVWKWCILVHFR